jgi:cell division protein FtsB
MSTPRNKKDTNTSFLSKGHIFPSIMSLVVGYFIYHIFQGERGFLAYIKIQKTLTLNEKKLEDLQSTCNTLERQVALMRPDNLCQDILEERVRTILNYGSPSEFIVVENQ